MWKLYAAAGVGVAIESTKARLESALNGDGIFVDPVRYMDFENDEIEKGHRHLMPFIKRKSFAHEQELRAIILLPKSRAGTLVSCDMDALIARIHISPHVPRYYAGAVRYIVERADPKIAAPLCSQDFWSAHTARMHPQEAEKGSFMRGRISHKGHFEPNRFDHRSYNDWTVLKSLCRKEDKRLLAPGATMSAMNECDLMLLDEVKEEAAINQ
jgi:hypothetical protein